VRSGHALEEFLIIKKNSFLSLSLSLFFFFGGGGGGLEDGVESLFEVSVMLLMILSDF
jgi:hypothetical protein